VPRAYWYLSIDEIAALPVGNLAADDCRLFLWVTAELNREGVAVRVARAWGFRPSGEIIWDKPNLGMGHFPRLCHEVLSIAVKGRANWPDHLRNVRSVQRWTQPYAPQGGSGYSGKLNSAKPPAAMDLIEPASPAPRVELFARQPRLGWDSWGWGYEGVTA
jgi:N6-adenosine-specific RNA methylase IME4